jgi:Acyl-coenzyme A:6-aminopenicillanic acid acyl-transferase
VKQGSIQNRTVKTIPETVGYDHSVPTPFWINDQKAVSGSGTLLRNPEGLWELYATGDPLQRGLTMGCLTEKLFQNQVHIFFGRVAEMVPSKLKQRLLNSLLKFYNRKLADHIPNEFKAEIYGLSEFDTHEYDFLAPRYLRNLYLHAAHDIGHAMQDLRLAGCTSFASRTSDTGELIIGRNCDFYMNDAFAEHKVLYFIKPDSGIPFVSIAWPGLLGVVSGMNAEGLTVTINAGKSGMPGLAKTPISILAREILQYAKTTAEAEAIARSREVFVSESIMVGSAADDTAVIIEKTPKVTDVFPWGGQRPMVCANHFQGQLLAHTKANRQQRDCTHSNYRFLRMQQLLHDCTELHPAAAIDILRNREGLDGMPLGYGNEKALNQLRAHHGVVFLPRQRKLWVSSNPWLLGKWVCYDLNTVFGTVGPQVGPVGFQVSGEAIAEDPFLHSAPYARYRQYGEAEKTMERYLAAKTGMEPDFAERLATLNPDYWQAYFKPALYFYRTGAYAQALPLLQKALTKETATQKEREQVERYLAKTQKKLK